MFIVSEIRALAFDLKNRKPNPLGKDFSAHLSRAGSPSSIRTSWPSTVTPDAKAGTAADTFKICVASFPDGTLLSNFKIGYQWLEPVSSRQSPSYRPIQRKCSNSR